MTTTISPPFQTRATTPFARSHPHFHPFALSLSKGKSASHATVFQPFALSLSKGGCASHASTPDSAKPNPNGQTAGTLRLCKTPFDRLRVNGVGAMPFDKLRANGVLKQKGESDNRVPLFCPFALSLSKGESTSHATVFQPFALSLSKGESSNHVSTPDSAKPNPNGQTAGTLRLCKTPFDRLRVNGVGAMPFDKLWANGVGVVPFDRLRANGFGAMPFVGLRANGVAQSAVGRGNQSGTAVS